MANPISVGAKGLLAAHVATSGWQVEVGLMPTSPDKCILLVDTGASESPNPKWLLDYPTLQVMVRGPNTQYLATWSEAKAIKDILLGLPSQDIDGDRWVSMTMLGDMGYIGQDENHRHLFSGNFRLILEPAASAETNRVALNTN